MQRTTFTWDLGHQASRIVQPSSPGYRLNIVYDAGPSAGKVLRMEPESDEPTVIDMKSNQRSPQ